MTINSSNVHAITIDAALELIADPYRRRVLTELMRVGDEAVELESLVDAMGTPSTAATSLISTDRQLRTLLRHTHLPKLAEYGVIDYDFRSGSVRYNETERVEQLVSFVTDELP